MSHSSDRAAAEPLAALVAVFAVTVGIALYAGVLDDAIAGTDTDRNRAAPTADLIEQRLSTAGILDPGGVNRSLAGVPGGYSGNVTVEADQQWSAGPTPPAGSDTAERTVHVRASPGVVCRGTLRVSVWR
jgi:hypothetical protein